MRRSMKYELNHSITNNDNGHEFLNGTKNGHLNNNLKINNKNNGFLNKIHDPMSLLPPSSASSSSSSSPSTSPTSSSSPSPSPLSAYAVLVDSVAFNYKRNVPLLKDVSLHVPKGCIYSLLGSNGCGKTTLLNILLGRIRPHNGNVHIFGQKPGKKLNHQIGYMPQELGLNPFLYIEDTFYYFAYINHITDKQFIQQQIKIYLDMLELVDPKQRVGQLSGGQKRLLSLGVTLIYKPRILFLDEPTVGIDSLIRNKIWTHLRQLCLLNDTTVIITTHYIDEAKNSNIVGFLRDGQLLAEESPEILMQALQCKTLENVFLRLCYEKIEVYRKQIDHYKNQQQQQQNLNQYDNNNNDQQYPNQNSIINNSNGVNIEKFDHDKSLYSDNNIDDIIAKTSIDTELTMKFDNNTKFYSYEITDQHQQQQQPLPSINKSIKQKQSPCSKQWINFDHLYALINREWFFFKHNLLLFLVFILMPLLTVYLFDSSYGRTPRNVPIAIYNGDIKTSNDNINSNDTNNLNELNDYNNDYFDSNDYGKQISDIFLEEFNTSMVRMTFYSNEFDAKNSVALGHNVIAIVFRSNFSTNIMSRYYDYHTFIDMKKDDILGNTNGSMMLYIDHSSLLNVRFVNRSILLSFQKTVERFGKQRGINPKIFSLPIEKAGYIYGVLEPHFQDLFLPGIIILTLLAMNAVKSAFEIIYLHSNGCLKRDINQGVRPIELLITFVISSLTSLFWQSLITCIFSYKIMNAELIGDFFEAFLLVYLTSTQGIFIGTLLSVLFPDQIISMLLCFTALVIMFFTSGTLWPLEGMSMTIQKILMVNPIVLPVRSLRSIMLRGWPMSNFSVLIGYLVSIGTSTILFIISGVFFHHLNIQIK